jgi:nucleotide-binding universal stress UspA family protein
MYTSVLVALDGSESAAAAIPHGVELAVRLSVQLVFLRVVPGAAGETHEGANSAPAGRRDRDARRSQAEGYLESLKRSLTPQGVKIEYLVREGDPAATILETARSLGQSPLVITPHGHRPPAQEGKFGAVAKEILRHAEGPVLLVRP